MKLRTWLATAFLVVMLLPLAAAYSLYTLVNHLDNEQGIPDYIQLTDELSSIAATIQDPSLYHFHGKKELPLVLEQYKKDNSTRIVLYNAKGAVVYNNNSNDFLDYYRQLDRNELYRNLYNYEMGYKTVSIKKPVFLNNQIVGFFEISVLRQELSKGVQHHSIWIIGLFCFVFLLIYFLALWLLNRRFNRPLNRLMNKMSLFAKGELGETLPYPRHDEIGELIGSFQSMKATIEETQGELRSEQKEKEMMIASLSHDLKTPLTSVQAYAEALTVEKELGETERMEYLQIMMTKTHYIKQMIEDITDFTLLQSNSYQMNRIEVDGEELFDMLLSGYYEPCRQNGISLTSETNVSGSYQVNVKMMTRLVDNLMGNAIRYTPSGKQIWLSGYNGQEALPEWIFSPFREEAEKFRDRSTVIIVQNEGSVMTEEQQQNAFQPFYQGDQSRTTDAHKGTGLGLSIAKMVAEKHDGAIQIWSKDGYGTLIICKLNH